MQAQLCISICTSCMGTCRSQPVKAKVPHDHPRLVYDIKYHGARRLTVEQAKRGLLKRLAQRAS